MSSQVRAELTKLGRRPAVWLLLAVAVFLSLTFTYLIPYAGVEGARSGAPNLTRGLAAILPDKLVGNSLGGLPVFVGGIALILGVLAVGGEYGWGTWKTVLMQGPSRLTVYTAKLVAVAVATLVGVAALFLTGALTSLLIAGAEGAVVSWPGLGEIAVGLGAGWLVATMWAALGVLLAVALRGVALALGLGLVWVLAVQNLLAGIAAPLLDWVAQAQKGLPGPNAGSLAASLGSAADTPGVAAVVDPVQATVVVGAYLLAFAGLGGLLLHRRDII